MIHLLKLLLCILLRWLAVWLAAAPVALDCCRRTNTQAVTLA
jgi:hypothetical protein